MKFNDYRNTFMNYQETVSKNRIISSLVNQILEDFPKNIPSEIRKPIGDTFLQLSDMFKEVKTLGSEQSKTCEIGTKKWQISLSGESAQLKFPTNKDEKKKNAKGKPSLTDNLSVELIFILISQIGRDENIDDFPDVDFKTVHIHQTLVMHFSTFEGILADSLRAICCVQPNVLKKQNKLTWEEILSVNSWNALTEMITEKFVKDLGFQSLFEKIETFRKVFGLDITLTPDEISVLKDTEIVRNLVVHNAGKINIEYLNSHPTEKIVIGDNIPLSIEYLEHISTTLQNIAGDLYLKIASKYFGNPKDAKNCVVRHERK